MFLSKLVLGFRMALDVRVGKYSIHSKESISFMEQLCPNDLLSVVKNELQFDFKETPPPYFEPNNMRGGDRAWSGEPNSDRIRWIVLCNSEN